MQDHPEVAPVLVLGGTGHYGRHIVLSLLEMGQPVRVLSRDAPTARQLLGEGVEVIQGDVTFQSSLRVAIAGVKAIVISLSAFNAKLIRQMRSIEHDAVLSALDIADRSAISRVVYISIYAIREDVLRKLHIDSQSAIIKRSVEAALASSEFNWTVLAAPPSMEIFFAMLRGSKMVVPGGGPPALPTVSPLDVGEIAAQAVLRDDLGGMRIRMTAPEALSFHEAARRISGATGKSIHVQAIPTFPLQIASMVSLPFNPYLHHLVEHLRLLNNFPQDVVADVPDDFRHLMDTFSYKPTTIEAEARRRYGLD